MARRVFQLFAAIAALAHAGDLDSLLVERARCEALASGEDEGEACTPVYYVELLVELGDAHLEQEERTEASEAYELAAMDSFESLGKDSREHSTALLRLASAHLYVGEYRKAHSLLSGWLRTDRSGWNYLGTDAERLEAEIDELDALLKQAEAAALGGMFSLAKTPLDALLEKVAEGGDSAVVSRLGTARIARAHLMMAGVLPNVPPKDLGGVTRSGALEQAAMHATEALELHQAAMYAEPDGDEGALNAGGGARRRDMARDWAGPGQQVEMSMCANLKASLLHELKSGEASAAASAAMEIQSAAAAEIGFDLSATAAALKDAKGDVKALAASMAAVGVAMYEAFQAHLKTEGRSAGAAAGLASFFGEPPSDGEEGGSLGGRRMAEEEDSDQSAMENALKGEM